MVDVATRAARLLLGKETCGAAFQAIVAVEQAAPDIDNVMKVRVEIKQYVANRYHGGSLQYVPLEEWQKALRTALAWKPKPAAVAS